MEEKEIVLSDTVILFLKELTTTLHQEEYFGFLESAETYVNDLIDGIYTEIRGKNIYHSPEELAHYGKYYVKVKTTKRTAWYIFFSHKGHR